MPAQLPNITTADKYTDANTASWPRTIQFIVQVANAAVFLQVDKSEDGSGQWGPEELFLAPTVGIFPLPCSGLRIRSAVAGTPAQVTVQLFNDGETLGGGQLSPFTGSVSAGGGVSQVVAGLTAVSKNGVLIGTESGLNVIEGAGITLGVVDNGPQSRVDVTLAAALGLLVQKAGVDVATRAKLNIIDGYGIASIVADNGGQSRVDFTEAVSLATAFDKLSAAVTMTNANTFYDGPSVSLAAGTWALAGTVSLNGASGNFTAKLWDGTTVLSSAEQTDASATGRVAISLFGIATFASTKTYKISVASNQSGQSIRASTPDNSAGNNASTLWAVRIA